MHPIDAASRGSTRLLEYLSCDGSLSGGGGAFVPDWRRSIIPRLPSFDDVELTIPGTRREVQFCFPPGLLAGLLASLPVLEPKGAVFVRLLRHQGGL